ncbi:MAG: hypothetical protein ACXWKM_13370, partial [Phenylobacterium sp.]
MPMTDLAADTEVIPLSTPQRFSLLAYAGTPILIGNFAAPYWGVLALPITFFLKNRLHLDANQTARFNLIVAIPLFLGFLFGFVRDRWSPFGRGDRGYLVLFGALTAIAYIVLAFIEPTYAVLLGGVFLITTLLQFAAGAAAGLASGIGNHHAMTGQMSTVMNSATLLPVVFAALLGGQLAGMLEGSGAASAARTLFLLGAALMLALTL